MDSAVATNGDVTNPRVRCLYAEARCCTHRDGALIRRISRSSQGVVCTRTDWGHQVAAQSSYQLFDLIRTRKSFCEKVVMWRRIMIPEKHLTLGGATSAAIALVGSLFNVIRFPSNSLTFKIRPLYHTLHPSLLVLCGDKRLRSNPTTLLVIFLSISNLIYTSLVLPLNALAMLKPM